MFSDTPTPIRPVSESTDFATRNSKFSFAANIDIRSVLFEERNSRKNSLKKKPTKDNYENLDLML